MIFHLHLLFDMILLKKRRLIGKMSVNKKKSFSLVLFMAIAAFVALYSLSYADSKKFQAEYTYIEDGVFQTID